MDMVGFLQVRAYKMQQEEEKKKPKKKYIDEVWPNMKSR